MIRDMKMSIEYFKEAMSAGGGSILGAVVVFLGFKSRLESQDTKIKTHTTDIDLLKRERALTVSRDSCNQCKDLGIVTHKVIETQIGGIESAMCKIEKRLHEDGKEIKDLVKMVYAAMPKRGENSTGKV